jgi:hypothetical protein
MIFLFTSVNFQKQMIYSGSSIMRKIITGNTLYLLCTLLEDGNRQGLLWGREWELFSDNVSGPNFFT